MDKTPIFIKDFSKKESPNERQETAQSIKAKRQEYFTKIELDEKEKLEAEKIANEKEKILNAELERINNLKNEISRLSELGLTKLLNYFELKKLQADLAIGQKTYEELKRQRDLGLTGEKNGLEKSDKNESSKLLQETQAIVNEFYSVQEKKWEESEYQKEDIEKYFSEENLSSLSLEEYILLLKRFPSEMVAHVTRQGIRDHVGHMYHLAGIDEYVDGFKKMTNDGRLRSPLGVYLVEEEKEKAIAKFLQLEETENKEDALENLNVMTDPISDPRGSYIDRIAIHFATEEVADYFYGSEKGNEIFIVYPSAHIASNYYFAGQLNSGGGSQWNDQWVWANEEKGMDLNAGIVFIPEKANVDKETGSRYELDKEKKPIKNTEYISTIRKLIDSDYFDDFAKQAMEIIGKMSGDYKEVVFNEKLKPLIKTLEQEFNITDPRLQIAILHYNTLQRLQCVKESEKLDDEDNFHSVDLEINEALKREGIFFKETTNKISSKEYWEAYFEKNIKAKPKHIVYYQGDDPTAALNNWKKQNGLNKKAVDDSIGFGEHQAAEPVIPQALVGMDRFKNLAEKVIDDYYSEKGVK